MEQIFNNKYIAQKKIASGSFGSVYLGLDKDSNQQVAIKIEKEENEEVRSLEREIEILERLNGTDGVPKLFWHGEQEETQVIVIQLLGKDLAHYLKNHKKFTLKTTIQLGMNMLRGLERLHERGVMHRDLKPENLLLGVEEEQHKLYIVDFGLSKVFRDKNNNLIPFRDNASFIGTTRYASIAAHKGYELSRKDDLESMVYILIYFMKGYVCKWHIKSRRLPWQNLQNVTDEERTQKVGELKISIDSRELCKELPIEFAMILEYVKALHYKSNPDYDFIFRLFQRAAENNKIAVDEYYDWDRIPSQNRIEVISNQIKQLNQQQSLQIPQTVEMKKSMDKSQLMRQSSNNLLAPPGSSGNTLQPPLKKEDNKSQTSASMLMSTYNSMRPQYSASMRGQQQQQQQQQQYQQQQLLVKMSMDSMPTQKKQGMVHSVAVTTSNQTETLGYKESVFDENFDECPLAQKYLQLRNQGVQIKKRSHTPVRKRQ